MDTILILDFGSQYTQLIARRIREIHYYVIIKSYNISMEDLKKINIKSVILSGGPSSTYHNQIKLQNGILEYLIQSQIPILGICYGLQYIIQTLQGKVLPSSEGEYGNTGFSIIKNSLLFKNINNKIQVWMSHGDKVTTLPEGFIQIGSTTTCEYAAIENKEKKIYGIQFHPEVSHTQEGNQILKNFCTKVSQISPNWDMKSYKDKLLQQIKNKVGKHKVLLGLSGGVDSLVTAKIIYEAIGNQLSCVYVDNGFMRLNETKIILEKFKSYFKIPLHVVDAQNIFMNAIENMIDPEKKRKIIGKTFFEIFQKKNLELGHHEFLAQGTLYTDIIESVSIHGPSHTIKSHHNRVQEILDLLKADKLIEPLKELFKDEVRVLGLELGLPHELLFRHPFPGPGLAIRIIGNITNSKLAILKKADAILLEELKNQKLYDQVWQAFCVFLPVESVGVMGDKRTYENVISIRIVESKDGMTADFANKGLGDNPLKFLGEVSTRIINQVSGVNRVVYDISSKPPSTIEWE